MKKIKISLIINIIIIILTIISMIIMFTGFKFMHGPEPILDTTKLGMFKFFTVDSNLFIGIISLIFAIYEIKLLKDNNYKIPNKLYLLKYMATVAVSLTMIVVFIYLGPISKDGIKSLLMNSNLFLHLVIPLLSIIDYVLYNKSDYITFKYTLYGLIPTLLYSIFYITNIVIHMENNKISPKYDWYWFAQFGLISTIITAIIILILTYVISITIWILNKKILKGA